MSTNIIESIPVTVSIEYCGVCAYGSHCLQLAQKLKHVSENISVTCTQGRQGSFEIIINDTLVYSKLQTMAMPDFEEVIERTKTIVEGGPISTIKSQQPITCVVS